MALRTDDWLTPAMPEAGGLPEASSAPPLYELRPLSLGEILDRTFALYRSRFWLFAGITAVSASVQVVVQAISLATAHRLLRGVALGKAHPASPNEALHALFGAHLGTSVAALAFFLVSVIANAATTLALSQVYLHRPVTAGMALSAAFRRWYRWIAIGLWLVGSMLWIFVLTLLVGALLAGYGARTHNSGLTVTGGVVVFAAFVGGLPAGIVLYLRNCLAVPAAMVEKLTVRAAMRRSKGLATDAKGRIFMVLLIAGVLYLVVGVLESPASLLMLFAPQQEHYLAQALTLLISFLGHTLVAPVGLIGLTLLYFDQRVRREALDLQMLLEASRQAKGPGDWDTVPILPATAQESTHLG